MRKLLVPVLLFLLAAPAIARERARPHSSRPRVSSTVRKAHPVRRAAKHRAVPRQRRPSPAIRCIDCERDSHGRIARSERAKLAFRKTHPCPATGRSSGPCPGYEIDHRKPLYKGGADRAGNMQWLTVAQHRAKHRRR